MQGSKTRPILQLPGIFSFSLTRAHLKLHAAVRSISEIYRDAVPGRPVVSFEVFPPRTEDGERALFGNAVPALLGAGPGFFSVTYGAGGSTRDKTVEVVDRLTNGFGTTVLAHLTCVNATRAEIDTMLDALRRIGCRNILALRGDPPRDCPAAACTSDFKHADELVRFVRARDGFCVGVAGFPEGHPECTQGKYADWDHLVNKIRAGAEFVITQLFFDNADFFEFRAYLQKAGVNIPIVPGIIPITSRKQILRFTELCGAKIPRPVAEQLARLGDDDAAVTRFGIRYAIEQCQQLIAAGVPGLHFFTLNRAGPTLEILHALSLV